MLVRFLTVYLAKKYKQPPPPQKKKKKKHCSRWRIMRKRTESTLTSTRWKVQKIEDEDYTKLAQTHGTEAKQQKELESF